MKNNNVKVSTLLFAGLLSSVWALPTVYAASEPQTYAERKPDSPQTPAPTLKAIDFFDAADLDQDGVLSSEEHFGLFQAQQMIRLEQQYLGMDSDKNSMVSLKEATAQKNLVVSQRILQETMALDGDKDSLSLHEYQLLTFLNQQARQQARAFARKDRDGDQQLDLDEHLNNDRHRSRLLSRWESTLAKQQERLENLQKRMAETDNTRSKERFKKHIDNTQKAINDLHKNIEIHEKEGMLAQLRKNKQLFNKMVPHKNYDFTYIYENGALPNAVKLQIAVRDGKVTEVLDLNGPLTPVAKGFDPATDLIIVEWKPATVSISKGVTINALFDKIENRLGLAHLKTKVNYHGEYGYPTFIGVSVSRPDVADGYSSYTIKHLEVRQGE